MEHEYAYVMADEDQLGRAGDAIATEQESLGLPEFHPSRLGGSPHATSTIVSTGSRSLRQALERAPTDLIPTGDSGWSKVR